MSKPATWDEVRNEIDRRYPNRADLLNFATEWFMAAQLATSNRPTQPDYFAEVAALVLQVTGILRSRTDTATLPNDVRGEIDDRLKDIDRAMASAFAVGMTDFARRTRGDEARAASNQRKKPTLLKTKAVELAQQIPYNSRRNVATRVKDDLKEYALANAIPPLTEDNAVRTIAEWLKEAEETGLFRPAKARKGITPTR